MQTLPADIYNRALDALGAKTVIGDFSDGTTASELGRRLYGATLRQLLRAAPWDFARTQAKLLLLGDASGQTLDPGTGKPISANVEPPWTYAYGWPNDAVRGRWLPYPVTSAVAGVPLTTAAGTSLANVPLVPARFLISSSNQFPTVAGQADWDNLPAPTPGTGPLSRQVILTDVPNASFVYTRLVTVIEEWESLFEQAMVCTLAAGAAMGVLGDRKAASVERAAQMAIARQAVINARVANGNESGFPQTTNHTPDWIRMRAPGYGAGPGSGPGYTAIGWETCAWPDGSVF